MILSKNALPLQSVRLCFAYILIKEALCSSCVGKRRNFSKKIARVAQRFSRLAWAAFPHLRFLVSYDHPTKCGISVHALFFNA